MTEMAIKMIGAALILVTWSASAGSHVLPWRAGEARIKGFGHCAKGPCMTRSDFSPSRPHHHHAGCIVMGSWRHSKFESCEPS